MTIEAQHYSDARVILESDLIVQDMAGGLANVPLTQLVHNDGVTPRFEFMQAANAEYAKRGGTHIAHLGAVAEALLKLLAS